MKLLIITKVKKHSMFLHIFPQCIGILSRIAKICWRFRKFIAFWAIFVRTHFTVFLRGFRPFFRFLENFQHFNWKKSAQHLFSTFFFLWIFLVTFSNVVHNSEISFHVFQEWWNELIAAYLPRYELYYELWTRYI